MFRNRLHDSGVRGMRPLSSLDSLVAAVVVLLLLGRASAIFVSETRKKPWARLGVGEEARFSFSKEKTLSLEYLAVDVGGLSFSLRNGTNTTVVLNGEPKSGTTWLEFVAKEILVQACQKSRQCSVHFQGRTVSTEMANSFVMYSMEEKHVIPGGVGHFNNFDFRQAPEMKSKELKERAIAALEEAEDSRKWLVIFRDPRDVTISCCYHRHKECPDADKYVSRKIAIVSAWINLRYRFFVELRKQAPTRVMIIFYEDMKYDQEGFIKKVGKFFGLRVSDIQAKLVREATTFSAMKDLEDNDDVPQYGAALGKVRSGEVCSYSTELSDEAGSAVTKIMRGVLAQELNQKWTC